MTTELGPGVVVAGRYRLERLLGRGGMGEVWAAMDELLMGPVALKFLDGRLPSGDAQKRLLKEAALASRGRHQNVVNVHGLFVLADGRPVMSMDALEGETLRRKLDREEALPLDVAASILLPIVSAVGTAHANGVIHRDLKPENVFLTPAMGGQLYVRVLDFGIAKLLRAARVAGAAEGTHTEGLRGTPIYMSPEQVCRDDVDHRTDIWSLGVVMFEVLAGARPIEAASFHQVVERLKHGLMYPLRAFAPDLPEDVLALVDHMLQRDPDARPHDLREVADVLRRYTNVVVPDFGMQRPEAPLPPDSNRTSARAVVQVVEKSDPYAATEVVSPDAGVPLPIGDAAPSSPRRRVAGVAILSACVLAGAWFWPHRRAPVPVAVIHEPRKAPLPEPLAPGPSATSTGPEAPTPHQSSAPNRPLEKVAMRSQTAPSLPAVPTDDAPKTSDSQIRPDTPTQSRPERQLVAVVVTAAHVPPPKLY